MSSSSAQYQEVKAGEGGALVDTSKGGGRDDSLGKYLPRVSTGGTLLWSRAMGAHGTNESEDRGSAHEFFETDHT